LEQIVEEVKQENEQVKQENEQVKQENEQVKQRAEQAENKIQASIQRMRQAGLPDADICAFLNITLEELEQMTNGSSDE
jgi:DNA-binding transcriptional regulator YhcF (GntR family)